MLQRLPPRRLNAPLDVEALGLMLARSRAFADSIRVRFQDFQRLLLFGGRDRRVSHAERVEVGFADAAARVDERAHRLEYVDRTLRVASSKERRRELAAIVEDMQRRVSVRRSGLVCDRSAKRLHGVVVSVRVEEDARERRIEIDTRAVERDGFRISLDRLGRLACGGIDRAQRGHAIDVRRVDPEALDERRLGLVVDGRFLQGVDDRERQEVRGVAGLAAMRVFVCLLRAAERFPQRGRSLASFGMRDRAFGRGRGFADRDSPRRDIARSQHRHRRRASCRLRSRGRSRSPHRPATSSGVEAEPRPTRLERRRPSQRRRRLMQDSSSRTRRAAGRRTEPRIS